MNVSEQVLYHPHRGSEQGISPKRQGAQGEALCLAPVRHALHEDVSHNEQDLSF